MSQTKKTRRSKKTRRQHSRLHPVRIAAFAAVIAASACVFAFFFLLLTLPVSDTLPKTAAGEALSAPAAETAAADVSVPAGEAEQGDAAAGAAVSLAPSGGGLPEPPAAPVQKDDAPVLAAVSEYTYGGKQIPAAEGNAALCIVFDDGGQRLEQVMPFVSLPFKAAVAVLPQLPDSARVAELVRESGSDVLLHQPMQAQNLEVNPGPGAILPEMSAAEARAVLQQNLAEIWPVCGVNNHEGSLITQLEPLVGAVLDVCAEQGIFFLDSRTTASSVVRSAADGRGMRVLERQVFLDNTQSEQDMLHEFLRGLAIANEQGYVIMIGHVWSTALPSFLESLYPVLTAAGYRFIAPSELYRELNEEILYESAGN